jgi:hypothetical protein
MQAFRQQPQLGRLVVLRLTDNPLMSPVFAERILKTIAGLTKKQNLAWGLNRFLEHLAGLTMVETGDWATKEPASVKKGILTYVSNLSKPELPTLKQAADILAADLFKRTKAVYLEKESAWVTDALVSELLKGTTQ